MRIKCLYVLLPAFIAVTFSASAQSWLWGAEGITGLKANLFARNIATNRTGNVYHGGGFESSLSFGSYTLTSQAMDDAYLVKYDANGNVLWARQSNSVAGTKTFARAVATDNNDNSYITGYTGDTAVFGTDTLRKKSQGFLIKYDANGNLLWLQQPPFDTTKTGGYAVTTDRFGHEYVTGAGAYLIKYDNKGNLKWSVPQTIHYYGSDSIANAGFSVATDGYGNVVMAGEFSDTLKFGTYNLYSRNVAAFIVKFDSSGNVLWAQQSAHTPATVKNFNAQNPVYAVAADNSGAIYLTSAFMDSIEFGSHLFTNISNSAFNFFIVKFNPNGSIIWGEEAAPLSATTKGWGTYSVCADDSGHIYIAGAKALYQQPDSVFIFDNDTITVPTDDYDAGSFILKLDSAGHLLCSSTLKSGGLEPNAVACDFTGKYVYMGGGLDYPVTIGSDNIIVPTGGFVPYVARWRPCECNLSVTVNYKNSSRSVCPYTAYVTIRGGTPGYTVTWEPGDEVGDTLLGICPGTYCCIVTDTKGCEDSVCITIKDEGINQLSATTNQLLIYPNPTSNLLTISSEQLPIQTIEIANELGQIIYKADSKNSDLKQTIDLSALPAAMYFITVTTTKNITVKPIVKIN